MLAFVVLLQVEGLAILGSFHWAVAFALIGIALILIAASPRSSLSLLAVAVTAMGGHLLADEEGSVLAVALVAVAWMAWNLAGIGRSLGPKKAHVPWLDLDKRCENLVEYAVLSPLTAKCLAAQGRLPWRLRRFLRYAADALLLKPFDGEIEFVHRRLRDHFALRELVPQLDEADQAVRTRAVAALGFQGVSAVDALSDLAQMGDVAERVLAVKALGRIAAPEATGSLEQSLSDPSPEVRAAVIGSLGNMGSADRNRLLKRAVGDDALAVQYALIDALIDPALYEAPDQLLIEILEQRLYPVELLRHVCSKAGVNDSANDLANTVGRGLPDAAREQVRALLKDSDAAVRLKACQWVANKAALGDLETLANLLAEDPVPDVRAAAASALAAIQDSTAVPGLIEALADDDASVCSSAARALSHFDDQRVVEPLIALLDNKSEGMREVVAKLLGQMGERRAVEPLIRALDDKVRAVRCEAARSLKKLGDQRAAEPLIRCLEDQDDVFWEWAAIALVELDPGRACAALRRFLSDKSVVKRLAAVRALAADLDSIPAALLSRDVGDSGLWLDPAEPITRERVARCATVLDLSENEIRAHYEALAPDFKLRLKW
jgi:HEAT repeat protein